MAEGMPGTNLTCTTGRGRVCWLLNGHSGLMDVRIMREFIELALKLIFLNKGTDSVANR